MSLASIGVSRPPATGCAGLPTSGPRSRCTASGGPCGTTPVTLGWCPSGRGRSSWMSPSSRRLGSVPQTLWIRTEPSDRVAHARSTRKTNPGRSRLLDSRQPSSLCLSTSKGECHFGEAMMTDAPITSPSNAQAEYWNSPAARPWAEQHERQDRALASLATVALNLATPQPGEHVLDIGCGSGTTVLALAARVGPRGHVLGADILGKLLGGGRPGSRPAGFQ